MLSTVGELRMNSLATFSNEYTSVGLPAKTYIKQLSVDNRFHLKDLPIWVDGKIELKESMLLVCLDVDVNCSAVYMSAFRFENFKLQIQHVFKIILCVRLTWSPFKRYRLISFIVSIKNLINYSRKFNPLKLCHATRAKNTQTASLREC